MMRHVSGLHRDSWLHKPSEENERLRGGGFDRDGVLILLRRPEASRNAIMRA